MCRAVVYHCETLWQSHTGPPTPFPRRAAKTAASPQQMEPPAPLFSFPQATKRWSKHWRWDWPELPSQMPGEGWDPDGTLLRACWAGTGAASAPLSTLSAPRWWSSTLFLSLLCLIHTLQGCCGTTSSPPRTQQQIGSTNYKQFNNKKNNKCPASCLLSSPPKEQNYKAQSSRQTWPSEGKDRVCVDSDIFFCRPLCLFAARRPTKSLSHQPVLYRQHLQEKSGSAVDLANILHDGKCLWLGQEGQGYQTQQATLTRPCTQSPDEPFSCCPFTFTVTWSFRPPLNYYHNFPGRQCRASGPERHPCFTECFVFYCL